MLVCDETNAAPGNLSSLGPYALSEEPSGAVLPYFDGQLFDEALVVLSGPTSQIANIVGLTTPITSYQRLQLVYAT